MSYNVIAIEREYASGGLEVGEKLAGKLGVPCYNRQILDKAAVKLKLPSERLSKVEESISGSLLFGLAAFANAASGEWTELMSVEQRLIAAETSVIRELALQPCVIIGRSAAAILKDRQSVLKAFIHADNEARAERAVSAYHIDPKQAESVLQWNDKRRSNYFKAAANLSWKDADLYHAFLNCGMLGIERTADILYAMAQ